MRSIFVAALMVLAADGARAGQPGQPGQIIQGQTVVVGQSPRDNVRPPTPLGTAVIRGRVFAADTGRPLRRARITVSAPELGSGPDSSRQTSTNPDGKYEIKDLPAGRYTVSVARSGYLTLRYGQRRPLEQGKPLQMAERQAVDNLDFTLPRMSLITGRVYDEANEPMAGAQVWTMRSTFFEGRRRLVPVGPFGQTDDAGQYRVLNLSPGTYYILATQRETWSVSEGGVDQTFGYAPTYFPGTPALSDARRVRVGIGQEAANTDFSLVPGRTATVSGIALDSRGAPLAGQSVSLGTEFRGPGTMMMFSGTGANVSADGSFTIKNVAPGDYKLTVRTAVDKGGAKVQESAAAPIVVNGVDLDNVTLMTSAGWTASGQVVLEAQSSPPPRDRIRVVGRAVSGDTDPRMQPSADSGRVADDWTFTVSGLFGLQLLRVNAPDTLMLRAILQNGRDIADTPMEMRSGEDLSGLQVVLTDKIGSVSGQLVDDKGAAVEDGTVIVFADDSAKWSENSRFVRSTRPDQSGKYQLRGLPAGEYLAVAVDYVQDGMWNDPEYLESLRRYAQRVTLGEGDARSATLKLVSVDAVQ